MHAQKAFAGVPTVGGAVADRIFETGVCVPSGSGLSEADQARVIEAALEVLRPAGGG